MKGFDGNAFKNLRAGLETRPPMIRGETSKTKTANNKVGVPALAFI